MPNNNYYHGNSSRGDAKRGAENYVRGARREFPTYEEAWAPEAQLWGNSRLYARMPWVLPRTVGDHELVRSYVSGIVLPCGTPIEAIASYDWRNRIAVPDAELNTRRYRGIGQAREELVRQIGVRHRRHHWPLRAIPSDYGVDAYAFRTLGEIGYVNNLTELDVSRWYGNSGGDSAALCWSAPILRAEFRYIRKPRLFWEWTQWEHRMRARTGLLIPYQCIEAECLLTETRHRRYTGAPPGFAAREMSPGCRAELPPVVIYKGSSLSYDPNSGFWTVFNSEWAARVAAWILWDAYDSYRLWYVPLQVRKDIRALKLDFVLGSGRNEAEVHRLLSVIDSINWREAEYRYTNRDTPSYEDPNSLAPGDYVWYDPWEQARVSGDVAVERRRQRPEIPSDHARGYVYVKPAFQDEDLENLDEQGASGSMPVNNANMGAPSSSGGVRRHCVGMTAAGPVLRTLRTTDALDMEIPANHHRVRIFLRDCGVDMNEVPRDAHQIKDWLAGRLARPRTVLCDHCTTGLCETCYTGYRNGDPSRVDAVMEVDLTADVGGEENTPDEVAAPASGTEEPTARF